MCFSAARYPSKGGIVDELCALIPSRRKTDKIVRKRIDISTEKLTLSTYQTSRRNLSSQVNAFLPLICAHPLRPGRTSSRRDCSDEYRGTYSNSKGRGPTRLMSPRRMFHNSGSSSRLVALSLLPNELKRCSSERRAPEESRAFVIDRNLRNSKT